MKKILSLLMAIVLIGTFCVFALGSGESETDNQGVDSAKKTEEKSNLGQYKVTIKGCRLAKDFEGNDVVIIKYAFTNNSDEPASFSFAFDDAAYQNGVGLNEAYVLADGAKYDSDEQLKEIKKGATIEVEGAYELNDTTTAVEVEVKKLFSFDDSVVKKTFEIK